MEPVAILELKKWGVHCGAKEKVGGANINVILSISKNTRSK